MNIRKPIFWDQKKPNFLTYFLFPFTFVTKIHNIFLKFFPKKKFNKIKTICIGNIYLGGTGKTPNTLKIYQLFKDINYDVVIGKKYYPNQKDEQILLKSKSSFISHRSRKQIINHAIKKNHELIVFDDGLQERGIDYDIKFVCFDGKIWIGNGFLIPSGPLRENINILKEYDGVILKISDENTNLTEVIAQIKRVNPKIEIFNSHVIIKNIKQFITSKKYLIFSGIGNASSFKEILVRNNFNIIEEKIFADHYKYRPKDIYEILEIAKKKNCKILTTEKDYVKIPDHFKNDIKFIEIDVKIDDEKKLIKLIKSKINETN